MDLVVSIAGLDHHYGDGKGRKQILHGVGLDIRPGEIVLLMGPSGSGKSTLLTLVGALRAVQQGSLRVFGRELRGSTPAAQYDVRRGIGYIFQEHNLLPFLTARQNVEMALGVGKLVPHPAEQARAVLATVGLGAFVDTYPATLSAGEKHRVAIARALVHHPRLVLADEPTAALDRESGRQCVELMRRLAKEQGCPILLVTHDGRIRDIADRILRIEDGRLTPA
jgi:putative ABC transport system ATP-binding protein